ncbi:MAG: hypothetical protein NTNFB02_00190 [Nitrospira sp.]
MRTKTWSIRIKDSFPVDDQIAMLILKLLVLREDFVLELAGMIQGTDKKFGERSLEMPRVEANIDENSPAWRQLYFYRNSLRTLYEIRSEVDEFCNSAKGKAALAKESHHLQHVLNKLQKQMATAEKTVARLRHNLGGHVSRGSIRATVRHMHNDISGFIQIGDVYGKTRYKFIGEIVMRMLLPGVSEHQVLEKLEELLRETSKLVPIFRTVDDLMGGILDGSKTCLVRL